MKRALTLIEIVVVVGIILLLLALVTSSFSSLIARAEERKTLTAMALLDSAIVAYEEGLGKKISLSPLAGGDGIGPQQLTNEYSVQWGFTQEVGLRGRQTLVQSYMI